MIAEIVMFVGAVLILLAALGLVRFNDTLARMHALTKATAMGVVLVLVGAAVNATAAHVVSMLLLAAALQLLTAPVAGHMIGRAVYRSRNIDARVDVVDELDDNRGDGPLPVNEQ